MPDSNAIAQGKVSLSAGVTGALIVAARPGRHKVRITGASILIGDSTVDATNGYPVNDGFTSTSAIELETDAAIYGANPTASTLVVSFLEFFNT